MSGRPPDFDELVGGELEQSERERLLRVHDLLIEAGPPPELSAELTRPRGNVIAIRGARRTRILALAAALGTVLFAIGFLTGDRADDLRTDFVVAMTGTGEAARARASLEIFEADPAGNWPMEMRVSGLLPSVSGKPYELWLTRGSDPAALCGSFLAEPDGTTVVPLNAPYKLKEFDGWVVVEEGSQAPLLTT